jgi:hypothetical protein
MSCFERMLGFEAAPSKPMLEIAGRRLGGEDSCPTTAMQLPGDERCDLTFSR